jgi:excisionase family DNA binding protein
MTERLTMTVPEAAVALDCSRKHIYDLVHAKAIPHVRIGRKVRIPSAALERWLIDEANRNVTHP